MEDDHHVEFGLLVEVLLEVALLEGQLIGGVFLGHRQKLIRDVVADHLLHLHSLGLDLLEKFSSGVSTSTAEIADHEGSFEFFIFLLNTFDYPRGEAFGVVVLNGSAMEVVVIELFCVDFKSVRSVHSFAQEFGVRRL